MRSAATVLLTLLAACQPGGKTDTATAPSEVPRPEHPRPDLQRAEWLNLNGLWSFQHDPDDVGLDAGWADPAAPFAQDILVPFAFEAPASGLGEAFPDDATALHAIDEPTFKGVSWYQRQIQRPEGWASERTFIVFGAVDWRARVWVDGVEVGSHEGGWLPFALDISDALAPTGESTLVVRVEDLHEDEPDILMGKQGGFWYTRSSGIWQTVYLEGRPATWLDTVHFTPDWRTGLVQVEGMLGGAAPAAGSDAYVVIEDDEGHQVWSFFDLEPTGFQTTVDLASLGADHPRLWSPTDPNLYTAFFTLDGGDHVRSYFGVRGFEATWAPGHSPEDGVPVEDQYQIFTLNGEPILLRGILDQNYHPDGLLTYPSEDDMLTDLEMARAWGFNLLRIHNMHPEPLKLYHCDRLGLLVMQDIPTPYTYLENVPGTPAREFWWTDLEGAWQRDHNHPALVSWVLFNEAWGLLNPAPLPESEELQDFVADSMAHARQVDPTRLVEDDSTTDSVTGAFDHVDTDVTSWHFYSDDYQAVAEDLATITAGSYPGSALLFVGGNTQSGQPLLVSEFGGASAYAAYSVAADELGQHFLGLVNAIRAEPEITGYIFTQLTDVEWEKNGLASYDRQTKDLGWRAVETVAEANGAIYAVLDGPPLQIAATGETITQRIRLAVGDGFATHVLQVGWMAFVDDGDLQQSDIFALGQQTLQAVYRLNGQDIQSIPLSFTLPASAGDVVLLVTVEENGVVVARNERGWQVGQ